jgi:hypothetical protein
VSDGGCSRDGISCDGACFRPRQSIDHCGSCRNRCGDRQLCIGGTCTAALGAGTSCVNPLVIPVQEGELQFRWSPGVLGQHLFPCGPLQPISSRFFRYTAPSSTSLTVGVFDATGAWLEVFSDVACSTAVSLGCKEQSLATTQRTIQFPVVAGRTYFMVVGGTVSSTLPTLAIAD